MLSAGGSFRIDPLLTFSSSCFASFNYPPAIGLFSCNATHLSYTNHQRNCFRLGRQSTVKAHCGFLLDSFTPHIKTFKRLLGAESKLKPWTSRVGEEVDKSSSDRLLQVVLYSPQIPGNTGTIARTCAASAVGLHLVEPLGFPIDDTKLKRAGLDYWPYVVVKVHSSWHEFIDYFKKQEGEKRLLAFTKKGTSVHTDIVYKPGDWLIFGSETSGLSTEVLNDCTNEIYGGGTVRIPILETYVRCLNLSVSVGIAVYEASRQLKYEQFGDLSSLSIESESMTE
ncbi:uncharacterized protein LOC131061062 isoform X2 [Cryptomeria japonica]|uniref:uncharacterized protein LOC131061062 isoform X2 n=1 Tax=Cryptomeria japonica TaxID=3369 RepID=UPI0027DA02A8|nr:uncharacterized protein LOC131061062 isoform X2 [Cryptomeria japonica]